MKRPGPSVLDELLRGVNLWLVRGVGEAVEGAVRESVTWSLRRVVRGLIASALLISAAVYLLLSVAEGLTESRVPSSVAYLVVALVGALGGLLLLRSR